MEKKTLQLAGAMYVHNTDIDNPYFNTTNVRNGGECFFNNLLRLSRISDIAVFKPARNFNNQNEFVRQIIQNL